LFGLDLPTTTRCSPRSSTSCCASANSGGHLVRTAPPTAHRPGRLPRPLRTRSDLGRRRRNTGVVHPRRNPGCR
jgi:hypothetical protein